MKLTSFSREKNEISEEKSWQLSSHTQAVYEYIPMHGMVHPPTNLWHSFLSVCTPFRAKVL